MSASQQPAPERLPSILVTGASGFIGRHFLEAARESYRIFAFARRSRREAGVTAHRNIRWMLVDIADPQLLETAIEQIRETGGVDFVLHLASFYDFNNDENPEYERTNVQGTRNLLEAVCALAIKRFIFASSLTVSRFPPTGGVLTERSPADAEFAYARSKRAGEELVREYSRHFPCSVVRKAAVISDWCEYGPLYRFVSTWISESWRSRIVAGRGQSAITYLHINSAVGLYLAILEASARLKRFDTYVGTPADAVSHIELFELVTRLYFGRAKTPLLIPKWLAATGILGRDLAGRLLGRRPFERLWMLRYVDRQLVADPSYTIEAIPYRPRARFSVQRRMAFIIENLKSYPFEWHAKNAMALRRGVERPGLLLSGLLHEKQAEIVDAIFGDLRGASSLEHYTRMDADELRWNIEVLYKLVTSSVRNNDRMSVLSYIRYIASVRKREGVRLHEFKKALESSAEKIIERLGREPDLEGMDRVLNDSIRLTMELAIDEAEDVYAEVPTDVETVPKSTREIVRDVMTSRLGEVAHKIYDRLTDPRNRLLFRSYQAMDAENLKWHVELIYRMLTSAACNDDTMSLLSYVRYLASVRKKDGFPADELQAALRVTGEATLESLTAVPELEGMERTLVESIQRMVAAAIDLVETTYVETPTIR